ncbi:MAG: right-handed parallel beta-helix repeat-containing protein [Candidatus Krumholzibacteria bacterium]|jgi:hypothetical protein|nr:right-handed parallel beta-helix repeat-containing protein [Candidatus Krumholzibacteria bacterium]
MKHCVQTSLVLCLLCGGVALQAAVIQVPGDYAQIHAAVQAAAAGDTVLVAAGTYYDCVHPTEGPGTTPACVIMRPGVTLRGAGSDATIIDAAGLGRGIFVEGTANVRIENLRVTGAYAEVYGAGILIRQASTGAEVTDVKIVANEDGGIVVIDNSDAILTRVEFLNNLAKQGGGLAVEEYSTVAVNNCHFEDNQAPSGAGMFFRSGSTVTMTGCVIINNTVTADFGYGGGVGVLNSHCDISGCEISGNSTRGAGGGLAYIDGATGLVTDCQIIGNSTVAAYNFGAGISCQSSAPTLRNLLIVGNNATSLGSDGGGIDIQFTPAPLVENCTLVGNSCATDGLAGGIFIQWGADPLIANCIIAGSPAGAGIACMFSDQATVSGCNFWQNAGGNEICGIDGGCNFSADPLFCNPGEGHYGIQSDSPCAAGNHPDGGDCGSTYCGAFAPGCGTGAGDLPVAMRALGNAPNPFNPQTTIFFVLDVPGDAMVRIYDLRGRTLRTFTRTAAAAGVRHEINWDGRDEAGYTLPSGVYLYRLESRGVSTTKRMSLIR